MRSVITVLWVVLISSGCASITSADTNGSKPEIGPIKEIVEETVSALGGSYPEGCRKGFQPEEKADYQIFPWAGQSLNCSKNSINISYAKSENKTIWVTVAKKKYLCQRTAMKELFSSLFGEQKLNRASLTHSGGEIAVVTRDVPKDGLVKGPNGPIYVELRCWESVGGFELRLSDYPLYLKAIAPYIR